MTLQHAICFELVIFVSYGLAAVVTDTKCVEESNTLHFS
jgi:hypothetical protein